MTLEMGLEIAFQVRFQIAPFPMPCQFRKAGAALQISGASVRYGCEYSFALCFLQLLAGPRKNGQVQSTISSFAKNVRFKHPLVGWANQPPMGATTPQHQPSLVAQH